MTDLRTLVPIKGSDARPFRKRHGIDCTRHRGSRMLQQPFVSEVASATLHWLLVVHNVRIGLCGIVLLQRSSERVLQAGLTNPT